mmetsp:Transcript_28083/g.47249  ORF Transcript_28083/g.47249 Transcript_28083/m.47249 type:complete len:252 (-) Transcript_28083:3958-4713(-)
MLLGFVFGGAREQAHHQATIRRHRCLRSRSVALPQDLHRGVQIILFHQLLDAHDDILAERIARHLLLAGHLPYAVPVSSFGQHIQGDLGVPQFHQLLGVLARDQMRLVRFVDATREGGVALRQRARFVVFLALDADADGLLVPPHLEQDVCRGLLSVDIHEPLGHLESNLHVAIGDKVARQFNRPLPDVFEVGSRVNFVGLGVQIGIDGLAPLLVLFQRTADGQVVILRGALACTRLGGLVTRVDFGHAVR